MKNEKLIQNIEKILKEEKEKGRGKLKNTVLEIKKSAHGQENFVDDGIVYLGEEGEGVFIGDTHGDLKSTKNIIKQIKFPAKNYFLIFLGDYVDRGERQLENLEFILNLKVKYKDRVFLLRGNHEEKELNSYYGFLESLSDRELWERFNKMFELLPNLLLTKNGILACHGGIPSEEVNGLLEIKEDSYLQLQMRWNDPNEDILDRGPRGSRGHPECTMFGWRAFYSFLKKIKAKVLLRSHLPNQKGFQKFFNDKLISFFSTSSKSRDCGYRFPYQIENAYFLKIDLKKPISKINEKIIWEIKY